MTFSIDSIVKVENQTLTTKETYGTTLPSPSLLPLAANGYFRWGWTIVGHKRISQRRRLMAARSHIGKRDERAESNHLIQLNKTSASTSLIT